MKKIWLTILLLAAGTAHAISFTMGAQIGAGIGLALVYDERFHQSGETLDTAAIIGANLDGGTIFSFEIFTKIHLTYWFALHAEFGRSALIIYGRESHVDAHLSHFALMPKFIAGPFYTMLGVGFGNIRVHSHTVRLEAGTVDVSLWGVVVEQLIAGETASFTVSDWGFSAIFEVGIRIPTSVGKFNLAGRSRLAAGGFNDNALVFNGFSEIFAFRLGYTINVSNLLGRRNITAVSW
ncbi:MAG: hypothetical protein FWE37_01720 [Spirochaetaceae bacterium]|nr:hypothetical protein [Spirochaetaceae bacterium]